MHFQPGSTTPQSSPPDVVSLQQAARVVRPALVLADDHPVLAHSLARFLSPRFRVLAPITDLELLEPAVRVSRPAVLVSDLDFRGVSALAVLKRLARDVPATRTVVLTGFDTEVIREGCLAAGVADFVAKIAPLEELTDAIDAAMKSSMETSLEGESSRPSQPAVARRSRHDHGPLIRWLLESGFPQQMIADAMGVSVKTVEYHSRRMRDRART